LIKRLVLVSCAVLAVIAISGVTMGQEQGGAPKDREHVTLREIGYPLYPGSKILKDLVISVAYLAEAEPPEVKEWYDHAMADEGWRFSSDWNNFGGQFQKTFLRGKALNNPAFAETMVMIGIAPFKKGGTHISIMPMANKYRKKN
jgi:hypothetical protein